MASRAQRGVKRSTALRILGRAPLMLVGAAALYLGVYRPAQLGWGATPAERRRPMPGDEIQPAPIFDATRALTIDASPDAIWPWLVQIGYRRAGWYSALDWADNGGIPSAERIVPELQDLAVGGEIPVTGKGDPFSFVPEITWRVVALERDRYLLAVSPTGRDSWLWFLEPAADGGTRLIWRMRNAPYDWLSPFIGLQLLTDLGDFVFVRNILLSIKERVEGRPIGSLAAGSPMVAAWFIVFLQFLGTLVAFVFRRDWARPLIAIALTSAATLALVFAMPPLWANCLVLVAVGCVLGWLYWCRDATHRRRVAWLATTTLRSSVSSSRTSTASRADVTGRDGLASARRRERSARAFVPVPVGAS